MLPTPAPPFRKRQLWSRPSPKSAVYIPPCTPLTLATGGTLVIGTSTIHISTPVAYQQLCTDNTVLGPQNVYDNFFEPFYASATPLIYVVAATTMFAWTLTIMLLITQGPLISSNIPTGRGWLQGRSMRGALTASRSTILGSSARPWLQKVAASLVAISLTIATADTFEAAQEQYDKGYLNAGLLRDDVAGTLEIRVLRIISNVFLYLAQVQTLIRLFSRQKEKLLIKWFGFLLILLDLIFSCLNSFYVHDRSIFRNAPRNYQDAIPALSYLFELSLSLLYAAWVFYYVATKRRYAFYHPLMPNICIVAFFSVISVLIPSVFFVTDIAQPRVSGWGDYFRWVGAAAASVIVWEWVERIEAIEREERKDGILGREIIDEDEMTRSSSDHTSWSLDQKPGHTSNHDKDADPEKLPDGVFDRVLTHLRRTKPLVKAIDPEAARAQETTDERPAATAAHSGTTRRHPRPREANVPSAIPTPVSRTETASAVSTVYAVHYHPVVDTPPPRTEAQDQNSALGTISSTRRTSQEPARQTTIQISNPPVLRADGARQFAHSQGSLQSHSAWSFATQAFRRKKHSPPPEVKEALGQDPPSQSEDERAGGQFKRLKRIGAMATSAVSAKPSIKSEAESSRQPTIIPAPPRGHTWSPEILRHSPIENGKDKHRSHKHRVQGQHGSRSILTASSSQPSDPSSSGSQVSIAQPGPSRLDARVDDPSNASRSAQIEATDFCQWDNEAERGVESATPQAEPSSTEAIPGSHVLENSETPRPSSRDVPRDEGQ